MWSFEDVAKIARLANDRISRTLKKFSPNVLASQQFKKR